MKHVLLALAFLLVLPVVSAVSISPGVVDLEVDGPVNEEFQISITNSDNDYVDAVVNKTGSLAEYITIEETEFELEPRERKRITISLDIPEGEELFGKQTSRIRAKTLDTSGEGFIQVQTRVATRLEVFFPYPGVFLEIDDFGAHSAEVGEDVTATWDVRSRGEQGTNYDWVLNVEQDGEVVDEIRGSESIGGETTESFSETIQTSQFGEGDYRIELAISYEDREDQSFDTFRVGRAGVDLLTFYPKEFEAGSVNRVRLGTKNMWPNTLEEVYAAIRVEDMITTTNTLDELRGADDRMRGQHNFEHFLDFTDFAPGEYEAQIEFRFQSGGESGTSSYTRNITLVEELDSPAKTGQESLEGMDPLVMFLLIISTIVTLFGVGALFMLYKKKDE